MKRMNVIEGATSSGEWQIVAMDMSTDNKAQSFYGKAKLLLSGEYLVLDGAQSLALPLKIGQSLSVQYSASFDPVLHWKSFDVNGKLWLEARFEFWRFNILDPHPSDEVIELQKILRQARKQNSHFLRDEVDVYVETRLGFPLEWGLGSSSTLIYNIAQWAYVSPFELQFKTNGGSGYDIACAQSEGPILYSKNSSGPNWSPTLFSPPFKEQLYFIYLGKKQNSKRAVRQYIEKRDTVTNKQVKRIGQITQGLLGAQNLSEFEDLLCEHEQIISDVIERAPIKDEFFSDYWGAVKSLGAWGGDFALVTSERSEEETRAYFFEKGFDVFLLYEQLAYGEGECSTDQAIDEYLH